VTFHCGLSNTATHLLFTALKSCNVPNRLPVKNPHSAAGDSPANRHNNLLVSKISQGKSEEEYRRWVFAGTTYW